MDSIRQNELPLNTTWMYNVKKIHHKAVQSSTQHNMDVQRQNKTARFNRLARALCATLLEETGIKS